MIGLRIIKLFFLHIKKNKHHKHDNREAKGALNQNRFREILNS